MNQWIRWKGIIPFVIITTGLGLFFLLFLDGLVKGLIESTGSDMVGARVETKNVDVHLSPLGISIDGLQVTNPEQPMSNAIEIDQIRFDLATDKLLLGKLIIEQMEVNRVRFDTPRRVSGAIKKSLDAKTERTSSMDKVQSREQSSKSGMGMPSLDLPDVSAILAREPLQTQALAEAMKASIANTESTWTTLQQTLPDTAQSETYQQRLDSLSKTKVNDIQQLATALQSLKALRTDLNGDIDKIQHARLQTQTGLSKLEQDYQSLIQAPSADKKRLQEKYTPSAQGVDNLSQLLFGNQVGSYVQQGLHWYEIAAPMLSGSEGGPPEPQRMTGVDVRFREYQPSPDFLIQRIHASVESPRGSFAGQILDVTHQPEIIARPVTFRFSGQKMTGIGSLNIQGKLDHIDRNNSLDQVTMEIKHYQVSRHSLSSDKNLQLVMSSAISDSKMRIERRNGQLDGEMNIHVHDIRYDNHAGPGEFQQVLVQAFNKVEDFNLDTRLTGTLKKPGLRITSDLDRRLNQQISTAFQSRVNKYQQELNQQIQQATEAQIAPVRTSLQQLRSDIDGQLKAVESTYQQQGAAIEQQIKQYQASIDAEKRKAEQAVNKQVQDKAKELLKQLQR